MLRQFIPLLAGGLLFSCSQEELPNPVRIIPDLVRPHVDRFILEAERRGVAVDLTKLSFEFETGLTAGQNQGLVVASCSQTQELQLVKIDTTNSFWIFGGEMGQEEVVFHELGHCLLNRPHKDTKFATDDFVSIMRTQGPMSYRNFNPLDANDIVHRRDYYLDELFDQSTAVPCWVDPNVAGSFPITIFEEDFIKAGIRYLVIDSQNALWFSSQNQLYRYLNGEFELVMVDFDIDAITTDSQGAVWIAGRQGQLGVVVNYNQGAFQTVYQDTEALGPLFTLNRFLIDQDQRLWFSTVQGDLWAENDQGNIIQVIDGGTTFTGKLVQAPDGKIWVVAAFKLLIFEDPALPAETVEFTDSGLLIESFDDLVVDANGRGWIIVDGFQGEVNLARYHPDTGVEVLDLANINMPDTFAHALITDSQEDIWLATSHGLRKWNGEYFSNYCKYNSGSPILSFSKAVVDNEGTVWGYGKDFNDLQFKLIRLETGI